MCKYYGLAHIYALNPINRKNPTKISIFIHDTLFEKTAICFDQDKPMKNRKSSCTRSLLLAAIGLLGTSPLIWAANFDALDHSSSGFENLEQSTPDGNPSSSSILNSLQQSEVDNKKDRYFEILNLLKQNKIPEAKSKITALLQKVPNEPQFYNLQGLIASMEKDLAGAKQSYQKAIDLDKNNLTSLIGLAKLALDSNDFATAKTHAERALSINGKFANAYLLLADIANKQKNPEEVERVLLNGLDKVKGTLAQEIELINTMGRYYVFLKQPEKILPLAEDLVKRHSGNNSALSVLSGAQIVNHKLDQAEQTLKQIIQQDPKDVNHRLLLVKILSDKPEREKDVLQLLEETAKIDPNNPQADAYKTAYFIKLKRNADALASAEKVDKQFPKLAIGKLLKGDIALSEQQWEKAISNYKQAYAIEPNINLLFKVADILQSQGKTSDAIALLDGESIKNNKNLAIHFKLATIYQQQNNIAKAQIHYEAILNQQADNTLALNNLAWLYSEQNNPKSLELAKKAHALAPDAAAVTDTYGYILLKQGQPKEALPILEQASAAAPKDNDVQYHLAEALVANNDKSKALGILETIVKSDQTFPEKAAAEKLLNQLKAN